ncbi:MAG: PstS family phosphate ABC transporter substrate-binding protein [Leptolyngbyaceae cyanobacterium SL_5_9]|nr:PstS family phosphate ABC transporter substrate-binding protein [Leptolyngbyaceae cyanobacterium SL_5_9]NJO72316.1 PstS family phosphate ABC transporter substrate-binding protein [Leptolyngbyaceae cyanobacterium RM1_406_9]
MNRLISRSALASAQKGAIVLGLAALAVSCTAPESPPQTGQQPILIDGSSTVFPITDEVAKEYQFGENQTAQIDVKFSGTTGGFEKFCAGETDINNASRPITVEEIEACEAAGVEYIELPVAYDALTVVVHPDNDWAQDITLEELRTIWEPTAEGQITRWNQIRPSWPDAPINLYGAGEDSGTFDYFTEAVVGESGASRSDYTASEDDTVLVQGVSEDPNALGYFGYAYYEESQNVLKAVAIDSGDGPVLPSDEAVLNAEYQPLARPLFIYVNAESAESKPEIKSFVEYYITNADSIVEDVGYVSLPGEMYGIALDHFQQGRKGTVFEGRSQQNLTIEQLLEREAAF